MKRLHKKKIDKKILFLISILFIISIISVYSASNLIGTNFLVIKQIIWYLIGIMIVYFILKCGNEKIISCYKLLYVIGNLLLLLLLFFATPVNNSKCWFNFGIFTFQPSEFMKIILIITNAIVIHKNRDSKEYIIVIKILVLTLIPSVLTFLEPDTGMVIIYFVISFIMLFISGINRKWFTITLLFLSLLVVIFLSIYFCNTQLFIKLFGTNFFYRIDRIMEWKNGTGYQLSNALIGIGSAHIFGFGFNNTPIYFPEAQTDFIFSVYASNFGVFGILLLFIVIINLDIRIIKIGINSKNKIDKYIISGIIGMLLYQQVQNIGMNIGLLPITGITLPFISYGGSSLLSYMIAVGLILNITKKIKN